MNTKVKVSVFTEAGKIDKGVALLERALRLQPENGAILFNLGVLHSKQGESEAARGMWESVLKVEPNASMRRRKAQQMLEGLL
jgi:cytochrome c-type biogenesis protein CcmH/NrfG